MSEHDFLKELIARRTARNPDFPRLMEDARRRRAADRAEDQDEGCDAPAPSGTSGPPDSD